MDYFDEYEKLTDDLQVAGNFAYSFSVGDILLEIDRSVTDITDTVNTDIANTETAENNEISDIANITNVSDTVNVTDIADTANIGGDTTDILNIANNADASEITENNSQVFDNTTVGNYDNSQRESRDYKNYGGVTVNFSAYNEINPSGGNTDIDAVMDAFGEKLAGIIASAAEGAGL